jgi:hypothetical protein
MYHARNSQNHLPTESQSITFIFKNPLCQLIFYFRANNLKHKINPNETVFSSIHFAAICWSGSRRIQAAFRQKNGCLAQKSTGNQSA